MWNKTSIINQNPKPCFSLFGFFTDFLLCARLTAVAHDRNHGDHSPSPFLSRYLGLSLASGLLSLLPLCNGESSSVSSSPPSRSSSGDGDAAVETPSLVTPASPSRRSLSSFPRISTAWAADSAWRLGLGGLDGPQLPREPSTELGLECKDSEGVSGSLIRAHNAPYGSWMNPTNVTPWSAASWTCCSDTNGNKHSRF